MEKNKNKENAKFAFCEDEQALKNLFAINLKSIRKRKGSKTRELAEALDVTLRSINKYEKAEALPTVFNLVRLADLLGVSVNELLEDPNSAAVDDADKEFKALPDNLKRNILNLLHQIKSC